MDNSQIANRKTEIESKFNELKAEKLKLVGQAQAIGKAVKLIDDEMREIQGAFKELCAVLGLDASEEAKKNEERFKADFEIKEVESVKE